MVKQAYIVCLFYWTARAKNWGVIWSNPNGCASYVTTLPRTYDDFPVMVNEECWLGFAWANSSTKAGESITGHATLEFISPSGINYTLEPIEYQDTTADPCWTGGNYSSGVWLPFGMWKFNEVGVWTAKMRLTDKYTGTVLDERKTLFTIVGLPPSSSFGVGNRHLPGDVDFDGFVSLTDVQMVQAQLGNNSGMPWGTGSNCYNPNADFDKDGFITDYDLKFVKSRFGATSPWYCVTKNPNFIDQGEGWEKVGWASANAYFIFNLNFGQCRAGTEYDLHAKAFQHYIDLLNLIIPVPIPYPEISPILALSIAGSGFTAATIGPDYLPDPNNPQPSPYDVPLNPENQEFYIESTISWWKVDMQTWLTYGFGGWIILSKPYTIHLDVTGPILGEMLPKDLSSRVIQVLFCTKDESWGVTYFPKEVPIGGDDWNRIWVNLWPPDKHFFVFQYNIDDQPQEKRTYHLTSSTFASLIDKIVDASLSDENILRNVPTAINSIVTSALSYAKLRNLDLTGAKFRPSFIGLQGKADALALGYAGGVTYSHAFEFYDMKKGVVWKPTLSSEATVKVK